MIKLFSLIKNKLKRKEEKVMINKTRLRAYTKTMANGVREIDEIPKEYRVPVYLELIADYNWALEMVDERYVDAIKKELGIYEVTMA